MVIKIRLHARDGCSQDDEPVNDDENVRRLISVRAAKKEKNEAHGPAVQLLAVCRGAGAKGLHSNSSRIITCRLQEHRPGLRSPEREA